MGQLLKLLLLAGLIAFVIHKIRNAMAADTPATDNQREQEKLDKPMTACAVCGVYIPEDEAIIKDNKTYCCAEHRDCKDD